MFTKQFCQELFQKKENFFLSPLDAYFLGTKLSRTTNFEGKVIMTGSCRSSSIRSFAKRTAAFAISWALMCTVVKLGVRNSAI